MGTTSDRNRQINKHCGGGVNPENCSLPLLVLFAGQNPNGSIKGAIKHQRVVGAVS